MTVEAQPQWDEGTSLISSNIATVTEQGKNGWPVVRLSAVSSCTLGHQSKRVPDAKMPGLATPPPTVVPGETNPEKNAVLEGLVAIANSNDKTTS